MTPTEAPPRRTQGLSWTADGRPVPSARRRLRPLVPDFERFGGWPAALGVTLLAGFLRFHNLRRPGTLLFDETYYAKDAYSLWEHGYAQNWVENANERIVDGRLTSDLMTGVPSMVVHPEVGKWLIGAGEQLFGMDAFGWRFASAVVGTLMVLVMARLVRRLTGSTLLGCTAGLLLCFDGLQLVLSRLALLDIFVAFFLLCAVACLVVDRDHGRARIAARIRPGQRLGAADWGPVRGLRWRPWRLAAGVFFGLAVSSKWTAVLPLAAFGLLVVAWDTGARRALGVRRPFLRAALVDGVPAFCYLVVVAFLVYVASWAGWLVHHDAYEEALARNVYGPYWGDYINEPVRGFFPHLAQGLRSLWHYHQALFAFHTEGLQDATHVYQSHPAGWPILNRPVGVAADFDIAPGAQGCPAPAGSNCRRQVLLLGTPVLWWGGVLALLFSVWAWVTRRDWRHGLVVVGLVATWLPWLRYAERPIFLFYAVTILPFTVISVTLLLGHLIGGPRASERRRAAGTAVAGSFVALVVLNFAWFWPVYTYGLLTFQEWLRRIWFKHWF